MLKVLDSITSFDIETAGIIETENKEEMQAELAKPQPIACTVVVTQSKIVTSITSYFHDEGPCTTKETANRVLEYLYGFNHLFAWNGAAFDLRMLGHAAENLKLAADIALRLYDPCFQFLWVNGFPVGLSATVKGFNSARAQQIQEKSMSGKDAPQEWATGDREKVLAYCRGDCIMTNETILAIEERKRLFWITKKGKQQSREFSCFYTVAECLDLPRPNLSWMDKPIDPKHNIDWAIKALS